MVRSSAHDGTAVFPKEPLPLVCIRLSLLPEFLDRDSLPGFECPFFLLRFPSLPIRFRFTFRALHYLLTRQERRIEI